MASYHNRAETIVENEDEEAEFQLPAEKDTDLLKQASKARGLWASALEKTVSASSRSTGKWEAVLEKLAQPDDRHESARATAELDTAQSSPPSGSNF